MNQQYLHFTFDIYKTNKIIFFNARFEKIKSNFIHRSFQSHIVAVSTLST